MHKPPPDSPNADDWPDQRIFFYDGECGLCSRAMLFFLRADKSARLHFASLQGETAAARLPADLRKADCLATAVYLRGNPRSQAIYVRSEALARAMVDIGGFWTLVGRALLLLPVFLRDAGYRFIAKYRDKIFSKSSCALPSPRERPRILD